MIRSQLAQQLKDEVTALRRFALFLTKSYEDADDLVQDTIERALLKAHLFDGENLRSWLFTVCRRIFLNQTRRAKSRGVSIVIDDAPPHALRAESNQEAVLDWSRLSANFERLPEKDRDLMRMIVIEGARYEDAAAVMEVPVGTVRSRLSRARARLQQMMEMGEPLKARPAAAAAPRGNGRRLTGVLAADAKKEMDDELDDEAACGDRRRRGDWSWRVCYQ